MGKKDKNKKSEENENIDRNEKVENRIIISIIFIFLMGALAETPLIQYVPDSLIIKNHDLSELSMIIFQTHATVATLGIAVIALLSGTNKDFIYGISISKYILNVKPKLLKHIRVTIFIFSSILITYGLAVFGFYNLLISVFVITIGLISKLIYDISIIFNGNIHLENEISSYITNEYQNEEVLKQLTKGVIDSIDKSHIVIYQANMKKLSEVFEIGAPLFKENNCDIKSFWENELNQIFKHSFKNLKSDNLEYSFKFLNEFYNTIISKEIYDFKLWANIYLDYFYAMDNIDNRSKAQMDNFQIIRTHLYNAFSHCSCTSHSTNDYYIVEITKKMYFYLSQHTPNENKQTIENHKIYIFNIIHLRLLNIVSSNKATSNEIRTSQILNKELREYTKLLIDNCENDVLNKTFIKILYNKQHINTLYILSIIIYIFYLSEKEPLVPEELKQSSSKFISDNKHNISSFLSKFDINIINTENVKLIFGYIKSWEFIPYLELKTPVFYKYISSTLICILLYAEKNNELLKKALESIVIKNSSYFVDNYLGQNKIDLTEDYKFIVCNFFGSKISKNDIQYDFDRLENLLLDIYRQNCNEKFEEEDIKELEKEIYSYLEYSITDKISSFNTQNLKKNYKKSVFSYEYQLCCTKNILKSNMDNFFNFAIQNFFYHISNNMIEDKKLIFEKVSSNDKQALVKLFNCTHSLKFPVDTIMGYRNWFDDYEKIQDFNKLLGNVKNIIFPKIEDIILLDKSKLSFKDLKYNVRIEDVDFDKFIKDLKINEDGKYLYYNTNSNILIPYEKNELIETIKNTRKIIKCVIKYKYAYRGNKIGAGIIFDKLL